MGIIALLSSLRTSMVLIVLTAIMGIVLYAIGIAIDGRQTRLVEITTEINRTHDQLAILEADWAYLSRPDRILHLATSLLDLTPLTPQQVMETETLLGWWHDTDNLTGFIPFHPLPLTADADNGTSPVAFYPIPITSNGDNEASPIAFQPIANATSPAPVQPTPVTTGGRP